jgi:hypothetical protein
MRTLTKSFLLVCILATLPLFGQTRVHILIRTFIPKDHPGNPGYVRPVPGQAGKFVIPSPIDSSCFMTDNRLFSSDSDASSRATTEFELLVTGNTAVVQPAGPRPIQRTGVSHKVDCQTGSDLVPPKSASTDHMSVGHPAVGGNQTQVVVDGRASNPLVTPSPEVQYGGHFTFDQQNKTLRFNGSVAKFPAYEIYAQLNNGPVVTVLQLAPEAGSTVKDLIDFGTGIKLRPVDVTITLP